MALPRLTKLELQVMDALWTRGASSVSSWTIRG